MSAIPIPFVTALLLAVLAATLLVRREKESTPAVIFVLLCTLTTVVVGLRWTFDATLWRFLLPILLSTLPVTAWYCFARVHHSPRRAWLHAAGPAAVLIGSLTYPLWHPPLGLLQMLLDLLYGGALIHASLDRNDIPGRIRLSDAQWARGAQQVAGTTLLIAAAIDGGLAIDLALYEARHARTILSISHAILLPLLAIAVIRLSVSISPTGGEPDAEEPAQPAMEPGEADSIVKRIDALMRSQELFLDPDLTLNRLARRAGIPGRQISAAINQHYGRNISQRVNEYRIERAKLLLSTTGNSITQIYLDSGFQTKSNFNREFVRVTGQTPSDYRHAMREEISSQGQGM